MPSIYLEAILEAIYPYLGTLFFTICYPELRLARYAPRLAVGWSTVPLLWHGVTIHPPPMTSYLSSSLIAVARSTTNQLLISS